MVVNGPFKLEEGAGTAGVAAQRDYWDKDKVKLDRLVFTMVEDINTELTMFETEEVDMTHVIPGAEIPRLKQERPDETHIFPTWEPTIISLTANGSPSTMSGCARR